MQRIDMGSSIPCHKSITHGIVDKPSRCIGRRIQNVCGACCRQGDDGNKARLREIPGVDFPPTRAYELPSLEVNICGHIAVFPLPVGRAAPGPDIGARIPVGEEGLVRPAVRPDVASEGVIRRNLRRREGIRLALPLRGVRIETIGVGAPGPARVERVRPKRTQFINTRDVLEGAIRMAGPWLTLVREPLGIGVIARSSR